MISFLYGFLSSYSDTPNDTKVANQYAYYWANLAAANDPNSEYVSSLGSYPKWPPYSDQENVLTEVRASEIY